MSNSRKHTGSTRVGGGGKLMRELNATSPLCTKVTYSQILNYDICAHTSLVVVVYMCASLIVAGVRIKKRIIMLPNYRSNMHITKVANCCMLSVAKQTSSQVQL